MNRPTRLAVCAIALTALWVSQSDEAASQSAPSEWRRNEPTRPHPPALDAAPLSAPAPADAVVLFDGSDLSAWTTRQGGPAGWKVENGYMEFVPGTGSLQTKEAFGDLQLHLEWATPPRPAGAGRDFGDSGVILMGRYEFQIVDSYRQPEIVADGLTGAIYGAYPPLVNATRAPGEWQSLDIVFRHPRFRADGSVLELGRATVLHNGVVVQNNEIIHGSTIPPRAGVPAAHAERLPFTIQGNADPVRFRNVWVRRLVPRPEPPAGYSAGGAAPTPARRP